ncbi:4323_t:CDS:2 [Cetraspora pellucida]|uniref:4323_t:CDS:1 n=1 Tax=Cetraspora pellucida TaxID=1433469 RepID=A0A9N9IS87_9GLOM|nr:4323_t:CDS:2 [Cetraspora pellucida]
MDDNYLCVKEKELCKNIFVSRQNSLIDSDHYNLEDLGRSQASSSMCLPNDRDYHLGQKHEAAITNFFHRAALIS